MNPFITGILRLNMLWLWIYVSMVSLLLPDVWAQVASSAALATGFLWLFFGLKVFVAAISVAQDIALAASSALPYASAAGLLLLALFCFGLACFPRFAGRPSNQWLLAWLDSLIKRTSRFPCYHSMSHRGMPSLSSVLHLSIPSRVVLFTASGLAGAAPQLK